MSQSKYQEAYNRGYDDGKRNAFVGFVYDNFDELSKKEQIELLIKEYGVKLPFWDIVQEPIYPLTIIADRYDGTYSGGKYLAFNMDFDEMPEEIIGDDVSCCNIFYKPDFIYGKGDTPLEAYRDLILKLGGETI